MAGVIVAVGERVRRFSAGVALAAAVLAWPAAGGAEVRKFAGHADGVTGVAFFPDGKRAASCGHDGDRTVRVWDLATGRELRRFKAEKTGFSALAVSPDGKTILAAGRDHVIRLWSADGPATPRRLEGHSNVVNHLAFSPDGRRAASTAWDGTLRLWDVATGKEVRRFEGHKGSVNGVAFSPDGKRLATGGADHSVRLWEVSTGKELRKLEGHPDWVGDVAFSPDGKRIASGGGTNAPDLILWDASTGAAERRVPAGPDAGWAVAFAGAGRVLAVRSDAVAAFDAASGRETDRLAGHSGQVYALAVAPDGRRVLTGGADKSMRLWELAAAPSPTPPAPAGDPLARAAALRKELERLEDADQIRTREYAFRRAVREAAAGFPAVTPGLEATPKQFTRVVLNGKRKGFDAVRFRTPAGKGAWDLYYEFAVPTGPNGIPVRFFNILPASGDMRVFSEVSQSRDEPIEGLDLPKNFHAGMSLNQGRLKPGAEYYLWFQYNDGAAEVPTYVKLRLSATHEVFLTGDNRDAQVAALEMPEGVVGLGTVAGGAKALVATGGEVVTVDLATGREVERRPLGTSAGRAVAFSPDGKLALVAGDEPTVGLFDLATGKERHALRGAGGRPRSLAFSPDGKLVLAGFDDNVIHLWDVDRGAEVRKFEGHTDQVFALAFSPDGRRFASGASVTDPAARVWDVATGKALARLEGNAEAVYAVAFSPDGKSVLTGGEDDSVRLFDAATGRQVRAFEKKVEENVRAVAFLPDGRRALSAGDELDVRLWDVATGESLARFGGHTQPVGRLAVSPDGRFAVSADNFGVVRVWRLPAAPAAPKAKPGGRNRR